MPVFQARETDCTYLDQVWAEGWVPSAEAAKEGGKTPNQMRDPEAEIHSPSPAKPSHTPFSHRDEARTSRYLVQLCLTYWVLMA